MFESIAARCLRLPLARFSGLVRSRRLAGALAGLVAGLFTTGAWAQTPALVNDPKLRAEYEALFQRTLADPSNLDANFQFATAATQVRDFEAAIGALERLLFFNPDLPRVRLELGVLYFRLGSYEMARSYFQSALDGRDVPSEVRSRVNAFLGEIDRRLRPNQWSVFLQAGTRYQSNANAGPNTQLVRALGFDAVLGSQFRRRPDWNWFGLASVRHVYDFENQRGDVFETQVIGYYANQRRFDRLNTGLIEIQAGPRLALLPDAWLGSSFRPYALAGKVSLGDKPYLSQWGGGISFAFPMDLMVIEPGVEVRQRLFDDSRDYRNAKEQTGQLLSLYVNGSGSVYDRLRWQARLAVNRNEARFAYASYDQTTFDLAFPYEFEASFLPTPRRWTLTPSFGISRTKYDAPNVIVDPNIRRFDREWRAGIALDALITQNIGIAAQVQYQNIDSRIRNFDTRNLSVIVGPTARF